MKTKSAFTLFIILFIAASCVQPPSPTTDNNNAATDSPSEGSPTDETIIFTNDSFVLQGDNSFQKTRLESKDSGDLDDNRIASHWNGLWVYNPLSDLLNETLHIGVKRYRLAINSGDQDSVDWTKPEFSVDPSHDEFITNLADNGIQITYFLSFWDKATWPGGGIS